MRKADVALLLRVLCGAAAVAYLVTFTVVALRRCGYPYELEWMEGAMVDHVDRILRGERVYVQPSLDFVPFIYGPVYFYLSALVAKVTGVGFLPLRLVSLAASLGSLATLYSLVAKETRDRIAGLVAAGAFAASYMRSAQFLDVGRVDALALFFGLAAIWIVRHRPRSLPWQLGAAALLGAAFLTKQSMLFLAFALIAWSFIASEQKKRALPFAAATLLATLGAFWALDWMHEGWLRYYLWELPRAHPLVESVWAGFWSDDLFPVYGVAGACGSFYLVAARDRRAALFFLLVTGALTGGAWSGRLHDGGWPNVLIPAFASLSLLFGLALGEANARLDAVEAPEAPDARLRHAVAAVVLLQLCVLAFNAKNALPRRGDKELGGAFIERIRSTPGDVWLPHHAWYARLAGKRTFAHKMAIDDVLRGDPYGEGVLLLAAIRRAIESRRFSAIVIDDDYFENEIGRTYDAATPPFTPEQPGFHAPTGIHIRPKSFYLAKP